MEDLGTYKTFRSKSYRCHFDKEKNKAIAMGPLPDLKVTFQVEADNKKQAVEKLSQKIGLGVFC